MGSVCVDVIPYLEQNRQKQHQQTSTMHNPPFTYTSI